MKRLPLLFVLIALPQWTAAAPSTDWIARAEKLQRDTPTASRALGLLEIKRSANKALDPTRAAADLPKAPNCNPALESIAWRMMPVPTAQQKPFALILDTLSKTQPPDPWTPVYRLYAATLADNRAALIAAAKTLTEVPTSFPSEAAEKAHFELLNELGVDDNQAALEVISHRSYAPLRALLDLDRALTKEIDFLQGTTRAADAKLLQSCRDRLRQAWLDNSKHLVERLFALHTLGREQDCDALLFAARDLPYLTDASEMTRTLARLNAKQAWTLLIQPLLVSEIQLIKSPPKLPTTTAPSDVELTIDAKNKSIQNSINTYEGEVHIRAGALQITCDKLALITDAANTPKLLSGAGHTSIRGTAFDLIECDNFSYNTDTGAFSLGGHVRLNRANQTQKFKAATLSRTGELRDTLSLLDDFENAPTIAAQLALLPNLTATYTDAEFPAEVRYFLALNLLRPHLLWHEAKNIPGNDKLEPFLREDALLQIQSAQSDAAKANRVENILQHDLTPHFAWTLKDPTHPDVARARHLLSTITTGPRLTSAQRWLAALPK
jgi:lipopolysaccharide export system protein LptA